MKLSEIKKIKSLVGAPDWREVVENIENRENDFEVNNYRFIDSESIDDIMQSELESDLYLLGCFRSWFLADLLGVDGDVIQSMQEAEAFEAIGKLIISLGKLEELQEKYASIGGYGHHFNRWDSSEHEITLTNENGIASRFYAFRTT